MKAALDSNVLIYAFDGSHEPERRELQRRAHILLQELNNEKAIILVPTVALAEFLVAYEPQQHGPLIAELSKTFLFPPLDPRASSIAAEIWNSHKTFATADKIKKPFLKGDALIVATAKAAAADLIYSNDQKMARLAHSAKLTFRGLPTHHENMFIDNESRGPSESI